MAHIVSTTEPPSGALGDEWYNPTTNILYKYLAFNGTSPTWIANPGVVKINSFSYPTGVTSVSTAGNLSITVNGSGFNSGIQIFLGSIKCATTFISPTQLVFAAPVSNLGNYLLYAYNTDGSSAVLPAGITYVAGSAAFSIEYLVVAGGGAGGNTAGGGGGGGGFRTATSVSVTPGSPIVITVGGGGTTAPTFGANGTDSTMTGTGTNFANVLASGGGGGGTYSATPANRHGRSGGSGGGGGGYVSAGDQTIGQPGTGNAGGYSPVEGFAGGTGAAFGAGGGGAGAVGGNGSAGAAGAGGAGSPSSITGIGSNVYYAGGGGASGDSYGGSDGGIGGGGRGQPSSGGATNVNGTINTGGGGGGGGGQGGAGGFGQGGAGVVIVRHPSAYPTANTTGSNVVVASSGGFVVYKYFSSGTITF